MTTLNHKTNVHVLAIGSNLDFKKNEEMLETSIKLANQKLTRANRNLEKNFSPFFGDLPSPSSSQEAVISRLASLYEDPEYGPSYFRGSTRVLKDLLNVYKALKTDPNCEMFSLNRTKTGIHIYINTVTRKKEVVIPVGLPGIDPVRINIRAFRSWYRKKKMAAMTARANAQKEMFELRLKVAQEQMNRAKASMELLEQELAMAKSVEKYVLEKDLDEIDKIATVSESVATEAIRKQKEDLRSHNTAIDKLEAEKGMYEETLFLEKMAEALQDVIKIYNNLSKFVRDTLNEGLQLPYIQE